MVDQIIKTIALKYSCFKTICKYFTVSLLHPTVQKRSLSLISNFGNLFPILANFYKMYPVNPYFSYVIYRGASLFCLGFNQNYIRFLGYYYQLFKLQPRSWALLIQMDKPLHWKKIEENFILFIGLIIYKYQNCRSLGYFQTS